MKNKFLLSILFASTVLAVSCKKDLEPQESTGSVSTAAAETPATPVQNVTPQNMQQQAAPAATLQQTQVVNNTPQPQAIKTAPGMNPPHGQPNHRCDIAVGAPLNSPAKPAVQNPATITPAAQIQTSTAQNPGTPAILNPNTATATTAPGMNPPHGQNGHRCDVAVGAPLPKA